MVEVVDVVYVVGEKCVDARARANKQNNFIYSGKTTNKNENKNKTSQSQVRV